MNTHYRFIEPLDVLFLRGNKLFGDPGSFGESLIPPWPSVAAGAIRSRILADDRIDLTEFAGSRVAHPTLGSPDNPGSFALSGFYLARKNAQCQAEILLAPPADLVIDKSTDGTLNVRRMRPMASNLPSSSPLPMLPILAQGAKRDKPESGYWLKQSGWQAYLNGETPRADQFLPSSELWTLDARVGIGMNAASRSVEEGKLFSAQAVVLKEGVGFVAAIDGAPVPPEGLLRFGGDGRAASIEDVDIQVPQPDYQTIVDAKRCCIVLTAPGLFSAGWQLPSIQDDSNSGDSGRIRLPGGISARLACAAVPRAETLSGWDLAKWRPKPAQRVVPTGSVYWLDELEASPYALRNLVEGGLWQEPCEDRQRKAEGFNRLAIGVWL